MLSLKINAIKTSVRLGVSDEERSKPQAVLIDVKIKLKDEKSLTSDLVSDSVDYAEVVQRVEAFCGNGEWRLAEKLAYDLARNLLEYSEKISKIGLAVRKSVLVGVGDFEAKVELYR